MNSACELIIFHKKLYEKKYYFMQTKIIFLKIIKQEFIYSI